MDNINIGLGTAPPAYVPIGALIANGDLATGNMATLAASVNSVPFEPSKLGDMKLYHYEAEQTNPIAIEYDGQAINLVQSTSPGSPGQETKLNPRDVKFVTPPRIARKVTVMATEVAGIRALGSVAMETVQTRVDRKLMNAVRDIRSTMEYHRVGGAIGLLLDADGSTVLQNYFTLLGITPQQIDVLFGTPATGKFITVGQTVLNMVEDALGNLAQLGDDAPIAFCGRTFFQRFVTDQSVVDAYKYFEERQQTININRDDARYIGFKHGGIIWMQYRGSTGNSGRFIPDAEAHIVVQGVPGTYSGYFCPPLDIMSKVNTMGEPIYPTVKMLDHEGGMEIQLQSNPIHVNNRPGVAIKLISSN